MATSGATATAVGFGVSPDVCSGMVEVPASIAPGAFALGAASATPAVSAFGSAAGGGFGAGGFGGTPSFGAGSAPGAPVGGTPGTGSAASVDAASGRGTTTVPAFGSAVGATPRARATASFGAAGGEGPGSTPAAATPADSLASAGSGAASKQPSASVTGQPLDAPIERPDLTTMADSATSDGATNTLLIKIQVRTCITRPPCQSHPRTIGHPDPCAGRGHV